MSNGKVIKTLRRIALCIILVLGLFYGPLVAAPQLSDRVPRIGFLGNSSRSTDAIRIEAFRQGLRELGHIEGRDIVIEYRYAAGRLDLLPELAAELVDLKVDIIVARGTRAARAARQVTTTMETQ